MERYSDFTKQAINPTPPVPPFGSGREGFAGPDFVGVVYQIAGVFNRNFPGGVVDFTPVRWGEAPEIQFLGTAFFSGEEGVDCFVSFEIRVSDEQILVTATQLEPPTGTTITRYNFRLSTTENGTTTDLADDIVGVPSEGFETPHEAAIEAETAILELQETRPDIQEVSYRVYDYEVESDQLRFTGCGSGFNDIMEQVFKDIRSVLPFGWKSLFSSYGGRTGPETTMVIYPPPDMTLPGLDKGPRYYGLPPRDLDNLLWDLSEEAEGETWLSGKEEHRRSLQEHAELTLPEGLLPDAFECIWGLQRYFYEHKENENYLLAAESFVNQSFDSCRDALQGFIESDEEIREAERIIDLLDGQFMTPSWSFRYEAPPSEFEDEDEDEDEDGVERWNPGWYGNLSAAGYMDQTDFVGPFLSEYEVKMELAEMYGDEVGFDFEDE